MQKMIIYNDDILKGFLNFFSGLIGNPDKFIQKCKNNGRKTSMLNLMYWYIQMADIAGLPDSTKLTFLLAMAEANIKIRDGRFDKDDNSTNDVKCFFCCMQYDFKEQIAACIIKEKPDFLETTYPNSKIVHIKELNGIGFDAIIDIFWNVRNSLVHGKNVWNFRFNEIPENMTYLLAGEIGTKNKKKKIKYHSTLSYEMIRDVMIQTVLKNIMSV